MSQAVIIGCGMGSEYMLSSEAKKAILSSEIWIGGKRLLAMAEKIKKEAQDSKERTCLCLYEGEKIARILVEAKESVAVLVSGDGGFYSMTAGILKALPEEVKVSVLPGISSLSYMAAKISRTYEKTAIASVHGRQMNYIPLVRANRDTFLLTAGNVAEICTKLCMCGMEDCEIYIGENLSGAKEKITHMSVWEGKAYEAEALTVLWVVNPNPGTHYPAGLPDEEFFRDEVPMTKSEVRAVTLSKLKLRKEDIVWDVGCGSGSVTVEMALAAMYGQVYAVDHEEKAVELTKKNCEHFGLQNVLVHLGEAKKIIKDFPAPDAVFIGGSKGQLKEIIRTVVEKNPKAKIVANMITLENVAEILALFDEYYPGKAKIIQMAVSRGRMAGKSHMMLAENPVYIVYTD